MSIENKIGIGGIKVTQLPNVRGAKAKTRFRNLGKIFNNSLQKTEEKSTLEKTKGHILTSEQEVNIVLAWFGAFKYFLFVIILLCFLQTI